MLREFFTGGPEVQTAKQTIKKIERKNPRRISLGDREILDSAHAITRRFFLTRQLPAIGVATIAVGTGAWGVIFEATHSDTDQNHPETDPQQAREIRAKLQNYEQFQGETVNNETLQTIATYVADLYKATFGLSIIPTKAIFPSNEAIKEIAQKDGLGDNINAEDPSGISIFQGEYNQQNPTNIKILMDIIVFLGKTDNYDPNISRLSVIRAVFMHEFIHSQTTVTVDHGSVFIGNQTLNPNYHRGLKYVIDLATGNQRGWFFDEINCQMLTEYYNDPQGNSDLFQRIDNSPVYDKSFDKDYFPGAALLRKIYGALGISPLEIARYYHSADSKGLLKKMDELLYRKGVAGREEFSDTFFSASQKDDSEDKDIKRKLDYLEAIWRKLQEKH